MTTICPNCDARFRDPPAEVPIERPLQCGACEHEWVRADANHSRRTVIETPPPLEPTMESLLDDEESAIRTNLPVVVAGETVDDTEAVNLKGDDQPPLKTVYVEAEPEIRVRKKSAFTAVAGFAVMAAIAGTIGLQEWIVDAVPQARSAYSAAGLASPSPDLSIADIKTAKKTKDGIRQLIIRGEIANLADHDVPVPPLKLTMRGESNISLYAWTVSAAKDNLKAGERSRFTAVAHDYPGDAVDVEVEFLPMVKK